MNHTQISKWNFTNVLTRIPTYVGCIDFEGSQGMALVALLSEFINEEFPLMNPDEVTSAFKAAASGKLMENGRKIEPNTYGKHLSANVVGKVLSAYQDFQKGERARPSGYNPNQLGEGKVNLITPKESHELIVGWISSDGCMPFAAPYATAYRYLVETNIIREVKKAVFNKYKKDTESVEIKAARKYYEKELHK